MLAGLVPQASQRGDGKRSEDDCMTFHGWKLPHRMDRLMRRRTNRTFVCASLTSPAKSYWPAAQRLRTQAKSAGRDCWAALHLFPARVSGSSLRGRAHLRHALCHRPGVSRPQTPGEEGQVQCASLAVVGVPHCATPYSSLPQDRSAPRKQDPETSLNSHLLPSRKAAPGCSSLRAVYPPQLRIARCIQAVTPRSSTPRATCSIYNNVNETRKWPSACFK